MKLKPLEIRALTLLANAGSSWRDPKQITSGMGLEDYDPLRKTYRVWNRLASINYLERRDNSEQVRGERRVHWSEFRLTHRGIAAVRDAE